MSHGLIEPGGDAGNGSLSVQGYRNGEPWYVWDIASEGISVGDGIFVAEAIQQ